MFTVGSFEAKTHLAALLERVSAGETIIITKHGKPVARLAPLVESPSTESLKDAIAEITRFRRKHRMTSEEIINLVREGRRY